MRGFYRVVADNRDLNYEKYLSEGNPSRSALKEYNSNNTNLLDVESVKRKLLSTEYVVRELADWKAR